MNAIVDTTNDSQGRRPAYIGPRGGTTVRPPAKMSYTYEAIVDLMLVEPGLDQNGIAKRLGYTAPWLSLIIHTDMFKAYFAQRRAEFNASLSDRISGKLNQAAEAALDSLIDGIATRGDKLTVIERKDVADTLLQRLGYGTKSAGVNVNVGVNAEVVVPVDKDVLMEARRSLRAVEELRIAKSKGEIIDIADRPVGDLRARGGSPIPPRLESTEIVPSVLTLNVE